MLSHISISMTTPDFVPNLPAGALVEAGAAIDISMDGCMPMLVIWNLPEWGGMTNPIWPSHSLWLAAADGEWSNGDEPFTVDPQPLGCPYPADPGCGDLQKDDFVFLFSEKAAAANTVPVPQGQTALFHLGSTEPADTYLVHNLRSYREDCMDCTNVAWFAQLVLAYD
jgi:hypothetical protein